MGDMSKDRVPRESRVERHVWMGMVSLGFGQLITASFAAGFGLATTISMRQKPPVATLYEKVAPPAFATNLSVGDQNVTCPVVLKSTPERTTAIIPRYCVDALKR